MEGCLESLQHLRGTPFWPNLDGAILFLETSELAPSPEWVDGVLQDYENMGVLAGLKGLIFGRTAGYWRPTSEVAGNHPRAHPPIHLPNIDRHGLRSHGPAIRTANWLPSRDRHSGEDVRYHRISGRMTSVVIVDLMKSPQRTSLLDHRESAVEAVVAWAESRRDIAAVGLVGSCARGTARPNSDMDFVILVEDAYISSTRSGFGSLGIRVRSHRRRGQVESLRVFYADGLEIEFGLASPEWASVDPIDWGTREVDFPVPRLRILGCGSASTPSAHH